MDFVNTVEADIVIVGGGLAGLYAALHAAPHARVALLAKGPPAVSNSMWAQGGIAAALGPDDSPALHLEDTLAAGRGLCSRPAAERLVHEGPACIHHLVALGVPFDRDGTALALGLEGGHRRRRIVHADGVATGAAVTRVVARHVLASPSVAVYEGVEATALLMSDGACVGVQAIHQERGEGLRFRAPAVVLATGGAAALYARSTNPTFSCGDGIALAFRAGAAVADMEFVQFHPTALALPGGEGFLLSEALRGEGALLRNAQGKRFMAHVHPLAELAPRDVVSRAIWREMQVAGADHVLLDLSPIAPATLRHHFGLLVERCGRLGVDLTREAVPVAPAAHYHMGGVVTDLDGATTVAGLFACGEVACTGVQGANRLASNSLLECLVFGRRAAMAALRWGEKTGAPGTRFRIASSDNDISSHPPTKYKNPTDPISLKALLWQHAGILRNQTGLKNLLSNLDTMEGKQPCSSNALLVAKLIATGALLREESRGGHLRDDFPNEAASWQQRIVFQQGYSPTLRAVDETASNDKLIKRTAVAAHHYEVTP